MTTLAIGDIIKDNHGREGIVFAIERRPGAKWISEQEDARVPHAAGPWWKVLPLDGGAVIVPDDLGVFVRRATVDDLLQLVELQQTDHGGRVTLLDLLEQLRRKQAPVRRPNNSFKPKPLRGSA